MTELGRRPLIVHTESGSVYEVTDTTMKRMYMGKMSQPLRQDGETLDIIQWVIRPEVGKRMLVGLKPLFPPQFPDPNVTFRFTSRVKFIRESGGILFPPTNGGEEKVR